MFARFLRHVFFIFIFLVSANFLVANEELLKEKDISNIMKQIFSEHVEKKEISKDILKRSFKIYIDQFDPNRTYLLQSQVEPFLNPTDTEMSAYIDQYKKGNFSVYDKLNKVIQDSIYNGRTLFSEVAKNRQGLVDAAKTLNADDGKGLLDPDLRAAFAKDDKELKDNIRHETEIFLSQQMRRFGQPIVIARSAQLLNLYKKQITNFENQYLFIDASGKPITQADKEHIGTLFILKSLANSLDAHTTFFDAAEAYDMRVHLEKELHGIGVVLKQGVEGLVVSQLVSGGPAEKSGLLKVNDEIVEVDGKSISALTFDKVMEMIRGKDGTPINLKIKRKDGLGASSKTEYVKITLKREPIVVQNDRVDVSYETFGNGIIGKIVLHSFYQGDKSVSSEQDVRDAIRKLKKQGNLRGLILDLRENSGGFLSQAVKVAGLFISNGVVVMSKYANGEEQFYRDVDSNKEYDGPLIVLTSRATASAAEIVAESLQDYGVALVVGDERTYGKGSIQSQTVTDNKSTSFFKVTVGKYYTVSGRTPQIKGVKADIVVLGPFSREHLGEEYLEYPLSYDSIEPAFKDKLTDVEAQYKPWFLKYYVPTIQQPTEVWKNMVPVLKKNSGYRIEHNKNYQIFLDRLGGKHVPNSEEAQKNFGTDDLQMMEAVNIMKDMIILHSAWNSQTIGAEGPISVQTAQAEK